MEDEPTNPLVEKNAPKIEPHPPVTEQPQHHGIETPERSEHRQRQYMRFIKIGLPLLGIVFLATFLIIIIAL